MTDHEDINQQLTRRLRRAGHFLYHQCGCGQQQDTVLRLLESEGPMSQKALGERLSTQGASVSELVSKLECKGLVMRTRSEEDRRCVLLQLTEKGQEARRFFAKRPENELYSSLTPQQKESLCSLLDTLLGAWYEGGAQ